MTRETKIGLLVGLAFIILFGIILSEKGSGRDQLTTTPIAAREPVIELVPSVEPQNFNLVEKTQSQQDGSSRQSGRPATHSSEGRHTPDPGTGTVPVRKPAERPAQLAPKMKELMPPRRTKALARIPASGPTTPAADAGKKIEIATVDPSPQKTILATHHVLPGETLAGICEKYYPGRAYKMVKPVMQANGIAKAKKLRAGQDLTLPVNEGSRAPAMVPVRRIKPGELAPSTSAHNTLVYKTLSPGEIRRRDPGDTSPGRWYVIRENDTLSKIARKFYGHQRAWHWLYDHNRDVIRNPHVVQPGQRIRLPEQDNILAAGRAGTD